MLPNSLQFLWTRSRHLYTIYDFFVNFNFYAQTQTIGELKRNFKINLGKSIEEVRLESPEKSCWFCSNRSMLEQEKC